MSSIRSWKRKYQQHKQEAKDNAGSKKVYTAWAVSPAEDAKIGGYNYINDLYKSESRWLRFCVKKQPTSGDIYVYYQIFRKDKSTQNQWVRKSMISFDLDQYEHVISCGIGPMGKRIDSVIEKLLGGEGVTGEISSAQPSKRARMMDNRQGESEKAPLVIHEENADSGDKQDADMDGEQAMCDSDADTDANESPSLLFESQPRF